MKKKNKKGFNLKEEYKKSWAYLKVSKNFIYVIVALFFVFVLIGFFIPAPDSLAKQILEFIEQLLEETQGMSQGELIKFIFFNNLRSSFYGMIFGVLLGIFPIIATIANGYLLGFVASISVENTGLLVLWRLLPHGIFELPAIFISLGLGLKFGINFLLNIHKTYFEKIMPSFVFFILCFLLLPISLIVIFITFLFFIYRDYVVYYVNKRKYFFLIMSIVISPIMILNIIFNIKLKTIWNGDYSNSLRVFFLIVLPLLIIAGIIEGSLIFVGR